MGRAGDRVNRLGRPLLTSRSSWQSNPHQSLCPFPQRVTFDLVIGLIAPLGATLQFVEREMVSALAEAGYQTETIHLSSELADLYTSHYSNGAIGQLLGAEENSLERMRLLQDAGDALRIDARRADILAIAAVEKITRLRARLKPATARAYLIRSLKTSAEIQLLKSVYRGQFYTISAFSSRDQREANLQRLTRGDLHEDRAAARRLIERDYRRGHRDLVGDALNPLLDNPWFEHSANPRNTSDLSLFGQQVQSTFHLADLFLDLSSPLVERHVRRFVRLIFGYPFATPTREEFAMFQAKAVSLRSSDLSRQVGAVIASPGGDIIASGANEVPKFGGGLHWPSSDLSESGDHRDFCFFGRGDVDAMRKNRWEVLLRQLRAEGWCFQPPEVAGATGDEPLKALAARFKELDHSLVSEFGRTVHAEMAALMDAVSRGVCVRGQWLYVTTFPCHTCAKHLIAAGLHRVIFIEPYPKSETARLWPSEIANCEVEGERAADKLLLEPFVGIAPSRYVDFFLFDSARSPRRQVHSGVRTVADWRPSRPRQSQEESYFSEASDTAKREQQLLRVWSTWFPRRGESRAARSATEG